MSKIAVSGGTGYVGRFIVDHLLAQGHEMVVLGRNARTKNLFVTPVEHRFHALSDKPVDGSLFDDCDAFVHAAFHHVNGKYRGGEGGDPEGFRRMNHDGSMALFKTAKAVGVKRAIFLSSRAVYGTQPTGVALLEETTPHPDTLYGEVKLETERDLAALEDTGFLPIILRATGIYGVSEGSSQHKWTKLFEDFENGKKNAPRIGSEVHGRDLAQAVALLLMSERGRLNDRRIFNISDILLDRRDLLESYAHMRNLTGLELPETSDAKSFNQMDCTRLRKLGWKPRGRLDLSGLVDTSD